MRVRRLALEHVLVDPIKDDLLSPARVTRMAAEMQAYYSEQDQALQARAAEQPRELQELTARIERLHERLRAGDPDMTADEIQAAIDRAETKRRELAEAQPAAQAWAKILAMLPKAAQLYREQVAQGLDGNPRAALKGECSYANGLP